MVTSVCLLLLLQLLSYCCRRMSGGVNCVTNVNSSSSLASPTDVLRLISRRLDAHDAVTNYIKI